MWLARSKPSSAMASTTSQGARAAPDGSRRIVLVPAGGRAFEEGLAHLRPARVLGRRRTGSGRTAQPSRLQQASPVVVPAPMVSASLRTVYTSGARSRDRRPCPGRHSNATSCSTRVTMPSSASRSVAAFTASGLSTSTGWLRCLAVASIGRQWWLRDGEVGVAGAALGRLGVEQLGVEGDRGVQVGDVEGELDSGHQQQSSPHWSGLGHSGFMAFLLAVDLTSTSVNGSTLALIHRHLSIYAHANRHQAHHPHSRIAGPRPGLLHARG